MTTLMWFRTDLRLADNPALAWACARGEIIPLYILDDETPPPAWKMGGASRWWLHFSLVALMRSLGGLVLKRGKAEELIPALLKETGADAICWNRQYEEWNSKRDVALKEKLRKEGITVETFNGAMLFEPWEIKTKTGGDYKVFTPFWAECLRHNVATPLPAPEVKARFTDGDRLTDWALLPTSPAWAEGWDKIWRPGETGAAAQWEEFMETGLANYAGGRNIPSVDATTRLSPHLHFGEISPRQIWHALNGKPDNNVETLKRELGWREFCTHVLYHFPKMAIQNWREEFNDYPWQQDQEGFDAWQKGKTGYPLVDAGMRELWATGYMHNRVRMVTASFLVKHLRIDWREGERWFWDTLVDADLANNAGGWQWVAGSGADAAPYFRIFNPIEQSRKFDAKAKYILKWCPELKALPEAYIHAPWETPEHIQRQSKFKMGEDYPWPIVEHGEARAAALAGYQKLRK